MNTPSQRLYRSRDDRMIGGVCGGLGNFFGMDPTVVRLAFVLLVFFGGLTPLIYLILLIVIPEEPLSAPAQPARPPEPETVVIEPPDEK